MKPPTIYSLAAACLLLLGLILAWGHNSGFVVGIAGLLFVLGGTLSASVVSNTLPAVVAVLYQVPRAFRPVGDAFESDSKTLLQVANLYRWSHIRRAESTARSLEDPVLRLGVQMVLDRSTREDLVRTLQRHAFAEHERDGKEIGILNAMATFAPAFGMLGTLLGLLHLLFGLGGSGLDAIGQSMGFAMMTTVFGLILANLVIKPVVIKFEQRARERLTRKCLLIDAIYMLHDQRHPEQIAEALQPLQAEPKPRTTRSPNVRMIANGLAQA